MWIHVIALAINYVTRFSQQYLSLLYFHREETCQKVSLEKQQTIIPPFDHYDVIAGQVKFLSLLSRAGMKMSKLKHFGTIWFHSWKVWMKLKVSRHYCFKSHAAMVRQVRPHGHGLTGFDYSNVNEYIFMMLKWNSRTYLNHWDSYWLDFEIIFQTRQKRTAWFILHKWLGNLSLSNGGDADNVFFVTFLEQHIICWTSFV